MRDIPEKYKPLLGEFAWHSLTADATIVTESLHHFKQVLTSMDKWGEGSVRTILEVGAYSHITGYLLQQKIKAKVTLFDLSVSTLKLGRQIAKDEQIHGDVDLYAGDFHSLPFVDDSFDVVYIYSALHHTYNFKKVARELQRVLATGGVLMVMNEPYLRKSCFYGFCTNRPGAFTSFEKNLDTQGIIRLIAEPHLGSRDESLFGMVENQQIPLQEFENVFSEYCEIKEITTDYETQVGEVEKYWLAWSEECELGSNDLVDKITADLELRINESYKHYDATAKGLGFALPDGKAIGVFCRNVAALLEELVVLPKGSWEARKKASELFGGSASIVCRKPGNVQSVGKHRDSGGDAYQLTEIDGVKLAFPCEINDLLWPGKSLVPPLHGDNTSDVHEFFPRKYWNIKKQDNGFYAVMLMGNRGEIVLPSSSSPYLLLLRINFTCTGTITPFVLQITDNRDISFSYEVFQEEAILVRQWVDANSEEKEVKLDLHMTAISDKHCNNLRQSLHIYYVGLFLLKE